jgi:hypothetical protein
MHGLTERWFTVPTTKVLAAYPPAVDGRSVSVVSGFPRRKGLTLCVNVARFIDVLMLGIQRPERRKTFILSFTRFRKRMSSVKRFLSSTVVHPITYKYMFFVRSKDRLHKVRV